MEAKTGKLAAVIDIGSSAVRMLISQWNGKQAEPLDYLERPIGLGQEVFSVGYITFETMRELSNILSGFCAAAREYDIPRVHATATTALREAANQAYILDHLAIQNKLKVQVLGDAETGAVLFNYLRGELPGDPGRSLLAYAGTGTVDLALQSGGQTVFIHSMHTGLLKIADLLEEASEQTLAIDLVAGQFLGTFLSRLGQLQDLNRVDTLLYGIGEMEPLAALCGERPERAMTLSHKKIQAAIDSWSGLSLDQLSGRCALNTQEAGGAYAALLLLHALTELVGVKRVRCVRCSFAEASMDMLLRPGARRANTVHLQGSAAATARALGARYGCDLDHANRVADSATVLFDKLRKLHGLSHRHRLLLQTACLLHEIGRFTNGVDPQEASYHLLKDTQIYGLSAGETLLMANIIAPQSLLGIERGTPRDDLLDEQEVLVAAKMHALLHLADALDYSRLGKGGALRARMRGEDRLELRLAVEGEFTLEKLMFRQSASLFREVFGVTPTLELELRHTMKGNG